MFGVACFQTGGVVFLEVGRVILVTVACLLLGGCFACVCVFRVFNGLFGLVGVLVGFFYS